MALHTGDTPTGCGVQSKHQLNDLIPHDTYCTILIRQCKFRNLYIISCGILYLTLPYGSHFDSKDIEIARPLSSEEFATGRLLGLVATNLKCYALQRNSHVIMYITIFMQSSYTIAIFIV